ncbi:MAG: class I SAM-dependent methyltransferase [Alphaproteobacteria bacterium]|nr:class I SAM-dependent methyltransferase [Alphaproteobacteria bacterium]
MMEAWRQTWTDPAHGAAYGELLYQRAIGALPEMESAKAVARRLAPILRDGDRLLDAGCGAGHFLVSIRRHAPCRVHYHGIDATAPYIDLARRAFAGASDCVFGVDDLFALALDDRSADVAMCNTVLPFLPSIAQPIAELCRVTRRVVILRMLVSERSFLIREVASREDGDELDEANQPRGFGFCNIYSHRHLRRLLGRIPAVRSVAIEPDDEFDPAALADPAEQAFKRDNATAVLGGMQVNGSIIMPWAFVTIGLDHDR